MIIQNKTIALLIDSDNISKDYLSIILDELSQYGNVTIRRLYGDFTKPQAKGWRDALLAFAIEQIQQVAFTKGKNANDSKMIIDAMDILYSGKVDCFCIATNDSDFTSLAMRFRNDNIVVIGACVKQTPESFKNACHRIIKIDELLQASRAEQGKEKTASDESKKERDGLKSKLDLFVKVAKEIIDLNSDLDGWMHFAAFMNEIYRKFNDFNPMLYGAENNKCGQFFKTLKYSNGKPVFTLVQKDNIAMIKIAK